MAYVQKYDFRFARSCRVTMLRPSSVKTAEEIESIIKLPLNRGRMGRCVCLELDVVYGVEP